MTSATKQNDNRYDQIRAHISDLIIEHQEEYGKILERVSNWRQGILQDIKELEAGPTEEQHTAAEETMHDPLPEDEANPALEARYTEDEKSIEKCEMMLAQLAGYMDNLDYMDKECDLLLNDMQKRGPEADRELPFILDQINETIFIQHNEAIDDAYYELEPETQPLIGMVTSLLQDIDSFNLASIRRECETAHASGLLKERGISQLEVAKDKKERSAALRDINDYLIQSRNISCDIELAAIKADCYNCELDDAIPSCQTDSLVHSFDHLDAKMELLQERLKNASTHAEIACIMENACHGLEAALISNQDVMEYCKGTAEQKGVIASLLDPYARPDNPYFLSVARACSDDSALVQIITHGNDLLANLTTKAQIRDTHQR